ncbi:MAG: hypothetical protein ACREF5_01495 [Candidatus Saccharimonadales bacterium]
MSNPESLPDVEINTDPSMVAKQQKDVADKLAAIYETSESSDPPASIAVALNNPIFYFSHENANLPLTLQERWQKLSENGNKLAHIVAKSKLEWEHDASGLQMMHDLVSGGDINANFRTPVAAFIVEASELFSESSIFIPCKDEYYENEVLAMESVLAYLSQ